MTNDLTYAIYFNSGMNYNTNTYINNSNVTKISIGNSDQDYYQNGVIELYNCSQQQVGDKVDIYINNGLRNSLEFSGYVARRQIHHKVGTSLYNYQLIGKTYDLWRYRTGSNITYTGYTSYIVSSLISTYCQGAVKGNINLEDGYNFIDEIDLSDLPIGDAIVKLISYDGFKFYVDTNGKLNYYDPSDEEIYTIIVEEDDIIDMSPIEEADEDLLNDVKIIGGLGYSTKTSYPYPEGVIVSSSVFKKKVMVAQQFQAKDDKLSAIRLYLDRTIDDNSPIDDLEVEIWDNNTRELFSETFDGGKGSIWSVTSNTIFDEGYLKLSPQGMGISQPIGLSTDYNLSRYAAQIINVPIDRIINEAIITCYHSIVSDKTLWIEIRTTSGTPPIPTTTLKCSGSVNLPNNTYYDTPINMNPKVLLTAGDYAIVAHLENPSTTNRIKSIYNGMNPYNDTSRRKVTSDDNSTWTPIVIGNYDCRFSFNYGNFSKSGYALSKPFGVNLGKKVFNRYMKIDIDGITSSNRIYLSGSNSGSRNWHTLNDEQWYDFSFENKFSSQIKIKLSGNGTYSPKVDTVTVSISDSVSGPITSVFIDPFDEDWYDDYTYMSGSTKRKIFINSGYLMMSGENTGAGFYNYWFHSSAPDLKRDGVLDYTCWTPSGNISDNSLSSRAYAPNGTYNWSASFKMQYWGLERDINALFFKLYAANESNIITIGNIYLSGNWPGKGWILAASPNYTPPLGIVTSYTMPFTNNCVYYNVTRILVSGTTQKEFDLCTWWDFKYQTVVYCKNSGSIQSKDFNIGVPFGYIGIYPTIETSPNRIFYSGSKNSGSTWYKIEKNRMNPLGINNTSGQHLRVMISMKPSTLSVTQSISSTSLKGTSPTIDQIEVKYAVNIANDLPKSGTKIDHSDEIYFRSKDISYPPSYSSYISYESPKLRYNNDEDFNTNNDYWLVLYHPSTSTQYFKYYYHSGSGYDKSIAYSWGGVEAPWGIGYRWSSSNNSSLVPYGSIIMDLGWNEDIITATSTNEQSITKYGRHQRIIRDSNITTNDDALYRADKEVEGMENIPRKGTITIDGMTGINTSYKLSSNLSNIRLGGLWEIVSFTHNIDKNGFTTTLNYGKQPFDITKRISDLEKEIY